MPTAARCSSFDWFATPADTLLAWPRGRPLLALCSCPSSPPLPSDAHRVRWSFLASPTEVLTIEPEDPDPISRLAAAIDATRIERPTGPCSSPFLGGWMVALGYELGRSVEPTSAMRPTRTDLDWPWSIVLWRCPHALAFDHAQSRWWSIDRSSTSHYDQHAESHASLPQELAPWNHEAPAWRLGEPRPIRSRDEYIAAARRVVEYIHAGDCFQVNLSHRIGASFSGSTRSLFASLLESAAPWYGAYLELPRSGDLHAALSLSPELLLSFDAASRRITTRPIKGTRPGSASPDDLRQSLKDQAELNMIVDLMRNDLGRVCRIGSVRVAEARAIEHHGSRGIGTPPRASSTDRSQDHGRVASAPGAGVHHGVATIEGILRPECSAADLLRAVFPGGSITGAPKVRAMQIIEELESVPRGLYTGAIGYISDCGNISLNIAIRTAVIRGRRAHRHLADELADASLTYGAGAGIVADSVPEQEWQETLDKAGVLWSLPRSNLPPVPSSPRTPQSTIAIPRTSARGAV